MLQSASSSSSALIVDPPKGDEPQSFFDLSFVIGLVRRQKYLIASSVAGLGLAGLVFVLLTPASYKATSQVIIDPRRLDLFQKDSLFTGAPIDVATVESQVQVVGSERIASNVIARLGLLKDPEFNGQTPLSAIGVIKSAFGLTSTPVDADDLRQGVLSNFQRKLDVRRVGVSYVVEIAFTSLSPSKAARIANAVGEAYIEDMGSGRLSAIQRASSWLEGRLEELRTKALNAEQALITFKTENDLVETGQNGRLMIDQQLTEASSQLIVLQGQTVQARARLEQIEAINKSGAFESSITDSLNNDLISKLRQQYLEATRAAADWTARYGAEHSATVELRNQMREIQRSMQAELRRLEGTYRSDYEIAKSREDQLRDSVGKLARLAAVQRQASVKLRELESTANNYRAIYDSFLQRYMQTMQQQSFPTVEARIAALASPPSDKNAPKTMLILAIALVAGSVAGTGAALSRELLDRSFRTSDQLAAATGAPCLGILPEIQTSEEAVSPPIPRGHTAPDNERTFVPPPVMSIIEMARFSRFAETLRNVKMCADVSNLPYRCRVIGVSSCLPGEGKSTFAANLALLIATGGAKVLLIDADLRNPGLTLALAPQGQLGLADAANRPSTISDIVYRHVSRQNFEFLPARSTRLSPDSYEVLGSERMQQLMTQHTKEYQYVIIDLPPLAPIVDVRAALNLIDGLVLVARWGTTSAAIMKRVLRTSGSLPDKLLGTVLNRVDVKRLKDYEGFEESYYYSDYYVQYENVREQESHSRLRRLLSAQVALLSTQVARLRRVVSRAGRQ